MGRIFTTYLGLSLVIAPVLGANPKEEVCLEQIQIQIPRDGEITILARDETSLSGRLKKVDRDRRLLYLEVFQSKTSRFLKTKVSADSVKTIFYYKQTRDWRIPVISGAVLGSAALALGLGFDSIEDLEDENLWVGMTAAGTVIGFVGGLLYAPSKTVTHKIECVSN